MKIFLLSTVYPAKYSAKGTTPVIHYFAKEWAATGNDVHVFHTASCFPKLFYVLGKPFKKLLDTKLGHIMPVQAPVEYDEEKDGVKISHIKLKKAKPHGRYSNKQIKRAFLKISSYVEKEGVPDCFVGHWDNPQLELLNLLKEKYHRPVCLVYHDNHFTHLSKIYGNDAENLVKNIDLVDSVYYIVAQCIGAVLGSLSVYLFMGASAVTIGGLGATAPGVGVSYFQAIFAEFLGTFFLMMVVMGVAVDKKAEPGFAGISIGMTVAAVIAVLGAFTGASINPARTFGPYLMDTLLGGANFWSFFPIYVIGPILGAICAAFAYAYLAKGSGVCELPQPFNDE